MSQQRTLELSVGIFLLIGIICISYLALSLGQTNLFHHNHYQIFAKFTSASGLKKGAYVEAAGVRVGKVSSIEFDSEEFVAVVSLQIDDDVLITDDAIASIRTSGIIGDKFVKLSSGGSDTYLEEGMEIFQTEPSINLEELISKYIFESGD